MNIAEPCSYEICTPHTPLILIERHVGLQTVQHTCTVKPRMIETITINRFVLFIATGSGQGPICGECMYL